MSDPTREGPSAKVWTESFRVRSYETDPEGRASLQALCNYLQEVAGNHARELGVSVEQIADQTLTWVLARLHVVLDRVPRWQDEVRIVTWPTGEDGLYATRAFELFDGAGERIGRAMSAWLLMDPIRRRPVRVPAFIKAIRLPDRSSPLPEDVRKLELPEPMTEAVAFHVRYSDLDLNRHVNNVCYVEWAAESVAPQLGATHAPAEIEIQFRAETLLGDTIQVYLHPDPSAGASPGATDRTFHHRLNRTSDGKVVAQVRTRWRPTAGVAG